MSFLTGTQTELLYSNATASTNLATFTTVTTATSERVVVAPGTVNRYLRVTADVTGSGSVTYRCSVAFT